MPVVMPTATGTRANVAPRAGTTPKRRPAPGAAEAKIEVVVKNPCGVEPIRLDAGTVSELCLVVGPFDRTVPRRSIHRPSRA